MTTLAEQFARLVASENLRQMPVIPDHVFREQNVQRSRTVYSIGEAIRCRGQEHDAKLGAGSI